MGEEICKTTLDRGEWCDKLGSHTNQSKENHHDVQP